MKNVVICSNHPILIAGLRSIIEASDEFSVLVCADFRLLRESAANGPAVVLTDVTCGITLEMLRGLREVAPLASVVLWVDTVSTEFISHALSAGVLGVLRKNAPVELHLECLRRVAAGELWVEHALAQKLLRSRTVKLAPRERQLMGLLTQGLKNKEMAWRMGVTEGTVKVYLSHLYKKVGANDRFELALLALKNLATDQSSVAELPAEMPFLMPESVSLERLPAVVQ